MRAMAADFSLPTERVYQFENEIHETIVSNSLFQRGERVAIAASGGKGEWSFKFSAERVLHLMLTGWTCSVPHLKIPPFWLIL